MAYRNYSTARAHIVDATGGGDFTTIQSAITAASSGDTVFIRNGTYTEDITHKDGVNVTSFTTDVISGNVVVVGKWTISGPGFFSISNIRLQTNGDFAVEVSGVDFNITKLEGVVIAASNNTAINFIASNPSCILAIDNTVMLITDTFAIYSMSSTGNLKMFAIKIFGPNTTTTSDNSSGFVEIYCSQMAVPFSTSSTGQIFMTDCVIDNTAGNVPCLSTNGTGSTSVSNCVFKSGTASCVSVGAGTTLNMTCVDCSSSNTNVLTGAGTLQYSYISFSGTSSGHNVTTETALPQLT